MTSFLVYLSITFIVYHTFALIEKYKKHTRLNKLECAIYKFCSNNKDLKAFKILKGDYYLLASESTNNSLSFSDSRVNISVEGESTSFYSFEFDFKDFYMVIDSLKTIFEIYNNRISNTQPMSMTGSGYLQRKKKDFDPINPPILFKNYQNQSESIQHKSKNSYSFFKKKRKQVSENTNNVIHVNFRQK
jgi:hypothetical protein